MSWTVGRVKLTKIVEIASTGGTRFILPQATPEEIQTAAVAGAELRHR